MTAPKSRVPAYGIAETGAPVGAVSSRIAWLRKGKGDSKYRPLRVADCQKMASEYRTSALEQLAKLNVDFDSPNFDLSSLKDAAQTLLSLHDNLRDVAAYQFLIEEDEFNRGVVRLPTPSAVREDMDKLSPSNRRRALGMIEQLLRKQHQGHGELEEA